MHESVTVETPFDEAAAGAAALAAIERLAELRDRVADAEERVTRAKDKLKTEKESLEEAQAAFNIAFDHEVRRVHGEQEDLPLFNQSDANAAAVSRPEVKALVALLAEVGYTIDPLIVAGYTEEQRAAATEWAQAVQLAKETSFTGPAPEPPAFLAQDDAPETVTPDTLRTALLLLAWPGLQVPDEDVLASWPAENRLQALIWTRAVHAARDAGREDVTDAEGQPIPMPAQVAELVQPPGVDPDGESRDQAEAE